MQEIEVRHRTTYKSSLDVLVKDQEVKLAPRSEGCIQVIDGDIAFDPPCPVDRSYDRYGNMIERITYPPETQVKEYSIVSTFKVLYTPPSFDHIREATRNASAYTPLPTSATIALKPGFPDHSKRIAGWLKDNLSEQSSYGSDFDMFCAISEKINKHFRYQSRDIKGVQTPDTTIALGSGACRDYAVFLIECARAMGFPARFASGYSFVHEDRTLANQTTHAWAQIYLAGPGWVDFDPTNRAYGGECVIPCCVCLSFEEAVTISGNILCYKNAHNTMEVDVCTSIRTVSGPNLDYMKRNVAQNQELNYQGEMVLA